MAAQPLVRESYKTPVDTFAVNVLGTVNVLEASVMPALFKPLSISLQTSVTKTRNGFGRIVKTIVLGGHDPYSASKTCSEIAAASYRKFLPY